MTNYGLPLRFKAVITEAHHGERVGECSEVFTVGRDVRQNEFCSMQNLQIWWKEKLTGAIKYDPYQSTGHHDAKGQEVFFGDIYSIPRNRTLDLSKPNAGLGSGLYAVVFSGFQTLGRAYPFYNGGHVSTDDIQQCVVIGNIHTPLSDLEARAKAVAEGE